jgi:uncharacterized iron-regulated membrane protein
MGVMALFWLVDCFVGFYLTLPRARPLLSRWRKAWLVKPRRLNFDVHRAGGLWLWPVLAILAFTSLYMNLGRELIMPPLRLIGEPTETLWDTDQSSAPDAHKRVSRLGWSQAAAIGREYAARLGWDRQLESVQWYPDYRDDGLWWLAFGIPTEGAIRYGYYGMTLDGRTGELIEVHTPNHGNAIDHFLAIQFPLHSGEIFGLVGRLTVFVAGLLIPAIIWSGIVIWWRKRSARSRRRSAASS